MYLFAVGTNSHKLRRSVQIAATSLSYAPNAEGDTTSDKLAAEESEEE